jgi:hypothetical protein
MKHPILLKKIYLNQSFLLTATLLLIAAYTTAQSLEEKLIVKVAHVEEFIERFNFEEGSYFSNYVAASYPNQNIDRTVVLTSLFNQRNKLQELALSKEFIAEISSKDRPAKLDFNDAMWYATVPLTLHTASKDFEAVLTLEVQLNEDYSAEWVIAGVKSALLPEPETDITFFIKPSSHATYFPELREVAKSTKRLKEVISERHAYSSLLLFEKVLSLESVTSLSISKDITYHFLQIPGWIFKVSNFNHDDSLNSGWLISDIHKASSLEMRKYEKDILGVR